MYSARDYLPQLGLQLSSFVDEIFPDWIAPLQQNKASNQSQCDEANTHSQPRKEPSSADATLLCRAYTTYAGSGSGALSDVPYPVILQIATDTKWELVSQTQTPTPWTQSMCMVGPNFKNTGHLRLSPGSPVRATWLCLCSSSSSLTAGELGD